MECRYPKSVKPIDDYKLEIIFDNNEKKLVDVKPYLSDPYFAPIKNQHIFETVKVNPFTVEWQGDIDISPETLYSESNLI